MMRLHHICAATERLKAHGATKRRVPQWPRSQEQPATRNRLPMSEMLPQRRANFAIMKAEERL